MNLRFLGRRKSLIALIVILVSAVAMRIIWLKLTMNSDEGEVGYDAMIWLRGELPYTARLSEKPPLLYMIYLALIFFFGNTVIPARVFNDALFFVSIIAFYLLVKNWFGRKVGLVASSFYVLFLNAPAFWGPYAVAIHLSMPFTIFSVLMCDEYVRREKVSLLFASGILLSIAGLIRLNSFAIIIVLFVILILSKRNAPTELHRKFQNSLTGNFSIVMAGIMFPLALVITYFWAVGALDKLIYNVIIRMAVQVAPANAGTLQVPFSWVFPGLMEGLPILVFSILGCIACILTRGLHKTYVLSWLLAPLLSLAFLEPHDSYHFAVLAPAASILSALALSPSLKVFHYAKDTKGFSSIRHRDIQRIFILTIFVLVLLPSAYFQALQFPSGTIHWDFVDWKYSTIGNYDQVMQLASYLRSLNVKDGEVLIQDWVPYVYWQTGIKAPSIHLDTYQIGSGIPLDDYERLLAEVEERKIPYVVVIADRPPGADQITDFVRVEYFPLKSIGSADIYSASYPIEAGVSVSFIAELHEAQAYALLPNGEEKKLGELNDTVVLPTIEKLTIDNITQYAIRQHPLAMLSNITYSGVQIPSNATLEFSIAMHPTSWTEAGDGVDFQIIIGNNGQSDMIFSKYIDPKNNDGDRHWFQFSIPLAEYNSKVVRISFITDPGPAGDFRWDWAYWGNPLIRQEG